MEAINPGISEGASRNAPANTRGNIPDNSLEVLAKKKLRNARILWFALAAWMSLYCYAAFQFTRSSINPSLEIFTAPNPFLRVLTVSAIVTAVASWLTPVIMLRRAKARDSSLLKASLTGLIFRLSFLMSVTMFGFVLSMTNHDGNFILPFFTVAALGYLISLPTQKSLALSPLELARFQAEKIVYPPASLQQKIVGWAFITLGILDGGIGGYATMLKYRHLIFDDDYLLRFGKMDMKLVFIGILILNHNRIRVKSPKVFWVLIGLLSYASLPGLLGLLKS